MEQRISLVTLGVHDLAACAAFYRALGRTARVARAGAATSRGGHSGVFLDPAGHPWEVAHNPGWTITDDGATLLGSGTADG